MRKIKELSDFYEFMFETREIRKRVVEKYFKSGKVFEKAVHEELSEYYKYLKDISSNKKITVLLDDKEVEFDISYEIKELEKDLVFVEDGKGALFEKNASESKLFSEEVGRLTEFLKGRGGFLNFVTDRDGTVNNYCARYLSSIQSIYNAVFLTEFAVSCAKNSIILTSAPLDNKGLVDISVNPDNVFIYAGSKGREYIDKNGKRNSKAIDPEKGEVLRKFNDKLVEILRDEKYVKFTLIGSGLQFKFGQTTIARQDIAGSIDENESIVFLRLIEKLVEETDPERKYLRIEDTGKDVEIILTVDRKGEGLKDFDKGDGLKFLDESIGLDIKGNKILVCGDTSSDIPMALKARELGGELSYVFVSTDDNLKKKLAEAGTDNGLVVSLPDVLVFSLGNLGSDN